MKVSNKPGQTSPTNELVKSNESQTEINGKKRFVFLFKGSKSNEIVQNENTTEEKSNDLNTNIKKALTVNNTIDETDYLNLMKKFNGIQQDYIKSSPTKLNKNSTNLKVTIIPKEKNNQTNSPVKESESVTNSPAKKSKRRVFLNNQIASSPQKLNIVKPKENADVNTVNTNPLSDYLNYFNETSSCSKSMAEGGAEAHMETPISSST